MEEEKGKVEAAAEVWAGTAAHTRWYVCRSFASFCRCWSRTGQWSCRYRWPFQCVCRPAEPP